MPKKKKLKLDPAVSFSKNLLGLKFMQRVQKVAEKESNCDDYDEEDDEKELKRKCIVHQSYQFCEKLKFGRLSFKGMNLDVEAMMHEA